MRTEAVMNSDAAQVPIRLAIVGDRFASDVVWIDVIGAGEVVDLRGRGLGRAESAEVLDILATSQPTTVLLTVSATPDAAGLVDLRSVERTVTAVEGLQVRLREACPTAKLVVQSIPPGWPSDAEHIKDMNTHIRQFCATVDAEYLDLWPTFCHSDGSLKREYTDDGVSLNRTGVDLWLQTADRIGAFDAIGASPQR
jgi:hypothetical protein